MNVVCDFSTGSMWGVKKQETVKKYSSLVIETNFIVLFCDTDIAKPLSQKKVIKEDALGKKLYRCVRQFFNKN